MNKFNWWMRLKYRMLPATKQDLIEMEERLTKVIANAQVTASLVKSAIGVQKALNKLDDSIPDKENI